MSGSSYYVPHETKWPFLATIALMIMFTGLANYMNDESTLTLTFTGLGLLLLVIYGWFSYVVRESEGGLYDDQVDMSFRWGMAWFIFSEVCSLRVFGALYARELSLPHMGDGSGVSTNQELWPTFENVWPPMARNYGGIGEERIPALNTIILLISGLTVTGLITV